MRTVYVAIKPDGSIAGKKVAARPPAAKFGATRPDAPVPTEAEMQDDFINMSRWFPNCEYRIEITQ